MPDRADAVVVGAGPNGLAAAVAIARAGRSVLVLERNDTPGGGARTAELTRPGFLHDVCSAIHPFGAASPFFRQLPLDEHGLRWVHPDAPVAHPLDDGTAVVIERSLEATVAGLGPDGRAYDRMVRPFVRRIDDLLVDALGPLTRVPRHPFLLARFGLTNLRSVAGRFRSAFSGEGPPAALAGIAAHSQLPLDAFPTGAPATIAAVLFAAIAHTHGFPMARGGSQAIADALASYLRSLGGEIECGWEVRSMADVPQARAVLFDVTPWQLLAITGDELPRRYRDRLRRFRRAPGVFKVDWALDGPVPWKADECSRAGTLHLAGTLDEIVAAEDAVLRGEHPERPYTLVAQQSPFDDTRAPDGRHTLWAYCHVPNGSTRDMTDAIEGQIERFAPGFRDRILERATRDTAGLEAGNPNCAGGDISGGAVDLRQFVARPVLRLNPYATPNPRLFLCSASTPPGPGVHGMCGAFAARAALRGPLR